MIVFAAAAVHPPVGLENVPVVEKAIGTASDERPIIRTLSAVRVRTEKLRIECPFRIVSNHGFVSNHAAVFVITFDVDI